MIRTFKALTLVLALSPLAAFAGTTVDVKVEGMTCGACVKKVNDELAKLKEIEKGTVVVSLEGNHATMMVKNNDAKTQEAVKKAIVKAGYKVAKIEVVGAAKTETKAN